MNTKRRQFILQGGRILGGITAFSVMSKPALSAFSISEKRNMHQLNMKKPIFKISLAQWSLHRTLRAGKMDNLDFAARARNDFGIEAVEYVNQFFFDKAKDDGYLSEMKKRASDHGVKSLLIMIDGEGQLGDLAEEKRKKAVENHHKWIDAAAFLGCHSIRVNAGGQGTEEEVADAAVQSLGQLCEYASASKLNVIVENHGGYSSNGNWLAGVIRSVGKDNCGTLPDFGNFCLENKLVDGQRICVNEYDRYKGMHELMPFAKGVSAKSHDFNEEGEEIHTDFVKMLQIVKDSGFRGYIDVEYEGSTLPEDAGIVATRKLLELAMTKLS